MYLEGDAGDGMQRAAQSGWARALSGSLTESATGQGWWAGADRGGLRVGTAPPPPKKNPNEVTDRRWSRSETRRQVRLAARRAPGHKRGPFCAVTLPTGSAREQASDTGTRPDPSDAERRGRGRPRETRLCWPPGCRRGPAAPTGTGRGRPRAEVAELHRHRAFGAPQPGRPGAAAPGRVAAGAERPLFAGDPAPRIRALGGLGSPTRGRSVPRRRAGQGAAALPARAARIPLTKSAVFLTPLVTNPPISEVVTRVVSLVAA